MDDDLRISQLEDKVNDLIEITEENNKILHSMERTARWSFWGKLLIWIVVLVLPFIVLGPLLKAIIPSIPGTTNKGLFGLPSEDQIQSLLKTYKAEQASTSSGNER